MCRVLVERFLATPSLEKEKLITTARYYPTVLLSFFVIKEHNQIALEKIQAWIKNLTRALHKTLGQGRECNCVSRMSVSK
jgi:hypothetical protein